MAKIMLFKKIRMRSACYFLLFCSLCIINFTPHRAIAQELTQWHFHADVTVQPQADDSFEAVYADFSRLLTHDLQNQGALDENSIRVTPLENGTVGAPVPFRFVKDQNYDAAHHACGTIIFQVAATSIPAPVQYRIFFDTAANGQKPAFANTIDVPETANMIWNGGFEISSQGYSGSNHYTNTGQNMPRGWWGNLRGNNNLASTAHSGAHALGFVAPQENKNIGIYSAPSPPGLRVIPGQTYDFSFWVKGEKLSSIHPLYASIYWHGQDQKYLSKADVGSLPQNAENFDWTNCEIILTAPPDAAYGVLDIGTYSPTGVLTVDDLMARIAVPPLLVNAQLNQ